MDVTRPPRSHVGGRGGGVPSDTTVGGSALTVGGADAGAGTGGAAPAVGVAATVGAGAGPRPKLVTVRKRPAAVAPIHESEPDAPWSRPAVGMLKPPPSPSICASTDPFPRSTRTV